MLYNVINDAEYVIQGKGLPFADTDEIDFRFKSYNSRKLFYFIRKC